MSTIIHSVSVTEITAAQILSLNTSPVQLVPGSAGYLINVYQVYIKYVAGTTAFNPGATDFLTVYTGNGENVGSLLIYEPIEAAQVSQSVNESSYDSSWLGINCQGSILESSGAVPAIDIVGAGLYLTQFTSASGDFTEFPNGENWTQGNGSLIVTVEYSYLEA